MTRGKALSSEQRGAILRMALAGCTAFQIQERTGLPLYTIRQWMPKKPRKKVETVSRKHDENGPVLE